MDKDLLIHLEYCLTPTHRINNAAIVISQGDILAVGGFSAFTHTEDYIVIDLPEYHAVPGFIDSHIYGAGGFDCMHADTDHNIAGMSEILCRHGVTSFLPTTQSADHPKLIAVIEALASQCDKSLPGAVPVGIHIEGPYISSEKRGAHPESHVRPINMQEVDEMIAAGDGAIKVFTFAPELDNATELIKKLREHGITPSMGHTVAEQDDVLRAIDVGALRCSHLLNGMEPLRQRKVGLAATAMTDERLWVEMIVDGVHIHPRMIDLACRCIRKDRIVCISNANEAAGLTDGVYKLGDEEIHVERGRSVLIDGVIAGSTEFLDQNYKHLFSYSHLTDSEVTACFTLNPAHSIGLKDRGEIKPGKQADIAIMNQQQEVQMTIINGNIAYCTESIELPENI